MEVKGYVSGLVFVLVTKHFPHQWDDALPLGKPYKFKSSERKIYNELISSRIKNLDAEAVSHNISLAVQNYLHKFEKEQRIGPNDVKHKPIIDGLSVDDINKIMKLTDSYLKYGYRVQLEDIYREEITTLLEKLRGDVASLNYPLFSLYTPLEQSLLQSSPFSR